VKKTVLLVLCLLTLVPSVKSGESSYNLRQTIEVDETAGIKRYSYPVTVNFPAKQLTPEHKDIRITDSKGNLLSYEVIETTESVVKVRFPADLEPNEKKTFYGFLGNRSASRQTDTFSGVQQYVGMKFVTYAWGTVKISSYTKNNSISIADNSNRMIRDADGNTIAQETYQAGTVRSFILAKPTPLRISCTGLASVAFGNFSADETDCEALIAGNILVYVPKFLSVTSFHPENKVQIWNKGEIAEEKILDPGETLVFDGISPGFRRIVANRECLIQYGTASAYSLFAVPPRGNVYRFLPLGKVVLTTGYDNTDISVAYPDGTSPQKDLMTKGKLVELPTNSYLSDIGADKTVKAIEITSSRPITVLGTGNAGGHGATMLFGNDGFALSKSWNTLTGDIDRENPANRHMRLVAPYTMTQILDKGDNNSDFPALPSGGLATSLKEYSVEFSKVNIDVSQDCFLIDGNAEDSATLCQVPVLADLSVKVSIPATETRDGGWIPGKIDKEPVKTEPVETKQESGFIVFLKSIWSQVNPKENPLTFALTLIGLAVLFIMIASLFIRKRKKGKQEEVLYDDFDDKITITKEELIGQSSVEEPTTEQPVPQRKKEDWFDRILDEEPKKDDGTLTFKAPKLRPPKISQFTDRSFKPETQEDKPQPKAENVKQEEQQTNETKANVTPASQISAEPPTQIQQEEPKAERPASEIDKINVPVSSVTPVARNLAHQLSGEGVAADPGAVMRLFREGYLDLFSKIFISQSASSVLPPYIVNMPIFDKVPLTSRDLERVSKLVRDLGIFDEVAKSIIIAEKMNLPHLLSSARLPQRMGKLKVTSVDSFC
jgi:outer membrane biosynthesis protein TonB